MTLVCPRSQCAERNPDEAERCGSCGAWLTVGPHRVATIARELSQRAIRAGRLKPGTCEMASEGDCAGRIEGHHEDYRRPLEVRWLCLRHHRFVHRLRRHGLTAQRLAAIRQYTTEPAAQLTPERATGSDSQGG